MPHETQQAVKAREIKTRELAPIYGRALFDSKTINKEARSVEVVFATETPVRQAAYSWDGVEYYDEILSMQSAHVRMQRLESGAPLLDNHNRWEGTKAVLGVVEKAWLSGTEGRAIVRFSKREDVEPTWQDVLDGILKGISVGYRVYEYEITVKEGAVDSYRAVDWEPFEISLAPVQADINSSIRSQDDKQRQAVNVVKCRYAGVPETENRNENLNPTISRMETTETPAGGATPAANTPATRSAGDVTQPVNAAEVTKAAVEGERKRAADIRTAVRAAKLEDSFADTMITDGTTIEKARELIIAKFAEADQANGQRSAQGANIKPGKDEIEKKREGMSLAVEHRAEPGKVKAEAVKGNEYRGMSLIRMAEECVINAGGNVRGMSPAQIAREALNIGERSGMTSTSDFPIILGNTVNRRLAAEYALAPQTFKEWTRQTTAQNFKDITRADLSEIGDFEEVAEGGEYKAVTMSESKEVYRVKKYGETIGITWETLVNDDLGAFGRIPAKIAQAAARLQSNLVYAILLGNPNMGDGVALFHASHGNLGTAADVSADSLGEARKLMRKQMGKGGKDFLNLMPNFLLVGPEKEGKALQYTSADYLPNTQQQINPYKTFKPIVEPRITGNQWFMSVTPGVVETIEYAFLEGEGELFTETRQGWKVDGVEIKARTVFGVKAMDWKGLLKNAGA
jgi:hypothetical protein